VLKHLHIRDFAIVEHLEIEFEAGFTVFTGETGAGKSILVEALGLVLGDRAGADRVRPGAARATIAATFEDDTARALADLLAERGLDTGTDACIVQRQIGADGRSRAFVNGIPTPLTTLAEIGAWLVDIHGQHAHHRLLHRGHQRDLLDDFGGHGADLERVADAAAAWQRVSAELESLRGDAVDLDAALDRLRYQVEELHGLDLSAAGLDTLEREHRRAANASRLAAGVRALLDVLSESEAGADERLGHAQRVLGELEGLDPALGEAAALVREAGIAVGEAVTALRRYQADLDVDAQTLARLEQALETLHTLARKHRCKPAELAAVRDRLAARLEHLQGLEGRVAALTAEQRGARDRYAAAAADLHDRRCAAATRLGEAVAGAMASLGMAGAQLLIEVTAEAIERPLATGTDTVEFLVSTNPGQPPRPLARVASGGELSRISLAIQMVAASDRDVPTRVYDEVDAGIGGRVAGIVGRELRRLGERGQILCVTHLPQVASLAHHHLLVEKTQADSTTRTRVLALETEARAREIARMLGGVRVTARTLAHAREMLAG